MSAEIIFWGVILFLGYTHAGYPLLLWVWSALQTRRPHSAQIEPTVSIIVVAYNEAGCIEQRLENLLALDYPHDRLEIILASDGSTDDTISRAQPHRRAGVMFVAYSRRRGKAAVLNDLIPQAHGDIVVLADARQRFDRQALRALVAPFADSQVGAVSGELILTNDTDGSAVGEGVGFYWKYEKFIRRNESRIDSSIGTTGAIYAIRRTLFEPIPADTLLDDVLIPMQIVRRGYRVLFEGGAYAYDRVATSAGGEFARKIRTLAGNFQLFARSRWLLNPFTNRLWLQTISHKGCRLLSPLALVIAFGINLFLLDDPLYQGTLTAQLTFYAAGVSGFLLRNSKKKVRFFNVPYAFCLLNLAVVVGFLRFAGGHQQVTWDRPVQPETGVRHPPRIT
jgi:cellulose synthase/poly-beta-1,6-N-acetylglucosamine synthase-like glycosyltransferase